MRRIREPQDAPSPGRLPRRRVRSARRMPEAARRPTRAVGRGRGAWSSPVHARSRADEQSPRVVPRRPILPSASTLRRAHWRIPRRSGRRAAESPWRSCCSDPDRATASADVPFGGGRLRGPETDFGEGATGSAVASACGARMLVFGSLDARCDEPVDESRFSRRHRRSCCSRLILRVVGRVTGGTVAMREKGGTPW